MLCNVVNHAELGFEPLRFASVAIFSDAESIFRARDRTEEAPTAMIVTWDPECRHVGDDVRRLSVCSLVPWGYR